MVYKMTQAFVTAALPSYAFLPFKKCNAPTVGMVVGVAAALRKAPEAERDVGRGVAVHAQ